MDPRREDKAAWRKAHRHERNDRERELRFRFKDRKTREVNSLDFHFFGTKNELENPRFIFVYAGKRRYEERLTDPLPKWE